MSEYFSGSVGSESGFIIGQGANAVTLSTSNSELVVTPTPFAVPDEYYSGNVTIAGFLTIGPASRRIAIYPSGSQYAVAPALNVIPDRWYSGTVGIGGELFLGMGVTKPRLTAAGGYLLNNGASTLTWAPPVLDANYMTWVPVAGSFGGQTLTAGGLDVLVQMPASAVPNSPGSYPSIRINGAKNVIIQGGRCSTPTSVGSEFNRDALIFSACTGVLHVEGMQLGLSSEWCMNGIEVYGSPLATLQVQNCEMVVRSSDPVNFTDGHPDGIFTDNVGGTPAGNVLGAMRIDCVRFDTDYQGLSLFGNHCNPVSINRLHVRIVERGQAGSTQGFWQADNTDVVNFGPSFYLTKRASQTYGLSVHPDSSDGNANRRPTVGAANITWPNEPTLIGQILQGDPPADFVPANRGIGYTPLAPVVHR